MSDRTRVSPQQHARATGPIDEPADALRPACGEECEEALARLQVYLDGELDDGEVAQVAAHLSACYPCMDRAELEQQVRALVRRSCQERAPAGLMERIRLQLSLAGGSDGASG